MIYTIKIDNWTRDFIIQLCIFLVISSLAYFFQSRLSDSAIIWWIVTFLYQQRWKQKEDSRLQEVHNIDHQIKLFTELWILVDIANWKNNQYLTKQIVTCWAIAELWIKNPILYRSCIEWLKHVKSRSSKYYEKQWEEESTKALFDASSEAMCHLQSSHK